MNNIQEKHGLVSYTDGHTEHYNHNQLHRDDGPAVVYPYGSQIWYQKGLRHRTDGPALVDRSGYAKGLLDLDLTEERGENDPPMIAKSLASEVYEEWWIHGKRLTENEFKKWADDLEMVD